MHLVTFMFANAPPAPPCTSPSAKTKQNFLPFAVLPCALLGLISMDWSGDGSAGRQQSQGVCPPTPSLLLHPLWGHFRVLAANTGSHWFLDTLVPPCAHVATAPQRC